MVVFEVVVCGAVEVYYLMLTSVSNILSTTFISMRAH